MKNLIFLCALISLISGCDSPQRGRSTLGTGLISGNNLSQGMTTSGFGSDFGSNNVTTSGTTTTTGGTTGSSNNTQAGPGFESCDLVYRFYTADLGNFGICQNRQDETLLQFRSAITDQGMRTCLIPTYKDATGSSTYLGQPQCTYTKEGEAIQGRLYKNRQGFESYPINGVMVMKERLLTPYFQCMNAYASYTSPACPYGARTNANCDAYAVQYRNDICNRFKVQYGTSYVDVRLR